MSWCKYRLRWKKIQSQRKERFNQKIYSFFFCFIGFLRWMGFLFLSVSVPILSSSQNRESCIEHLIRASFINWFSFFSMYKQLSTILFVFSLSLFQFASPTYPQSLRLACFLSSVLFFHSFLYPLISGFKWRIPTKRKKRMQTEKVKAPKTKRLWIPKQWQWIYPCVLLPIHAHTHTHIHTSHHIKSLHFTYTK